MSTRWIPFAFCTDGGFVGWAVASVLAYYKYSWFILTGMSPKLYLMFLLIYGQIEELFFWWILTHQFPQPQPECRLDYDAVFEKARMNGMPSVETQLSFSLSFFVIGHYIISGNYPSYFITLLVTALPWIVGGGLYATTNNTALQIIVGGFIGGTNGVKRILLYHYFLKEGLIELIHRFPFLMAFTLDSD